MNTASPHMQSKRKLSWRLWVIVLLVIAITSVIVTFFVYNGPLSNKDFTDIEKKMQGVYADMNLPNVETKKICYEYKDSMSSVLKCQVEMAAFVNFSDLNNIRRITTNYEQRLRLLSAKDFTLQESLRDTGTMIWSGSFVPKDGKLSMGCSAKIVAQGEKVNVGRALGAYNLTDRAALVLACGGQSQEAYFRRIL